MKVFSSILGGCESRSHSAPQQRQQSSEFGSQAALRPQAPWRQLLIRALLGDWGLGFWSGAAGKRLRCLPVRPAGRLSDPLCSVRTCSVIMQGREVKMHKVSCLMLEGSSRQSRPFCWFRAESRERTSLVPGQLCPLHENVIYPSLKENLNNNLAELKSFTISSVQF